MECTLSDPARRLEMVAITNPRGLLDAPAAAGDATERRRLLVRGVVQGVGFRPFVWRLARDYGLTGFVRNTSGGVVIEIEGEASAVDRVVDALSAEAPPLAQVAEVTSLPVPVRGEQGFVIEESVAVEGAYQPIAPDAATCADCLRELFDAADRRHRYPFINCTNCGPRFTIIEDVPYDRPLTTMRHFAMCEPCRSEFQDPSDRRFHAQPIACPACGPRLWSSDRHGRALSGDAITAGVVALRGGEIVALKGLGGFQLACDARDAGVVARLRERKRRPGKPFAVMVNDLQAARQFCHVSEAEAATLGGTVRPVVLLRRRADSGDAMAAGVAPGLDELGIMLPYTPLHHLLLHELDGAPLVMTSGNLSEEPIAKGNDEALTQLGQIADSFLLHDRAIYARYDDSVVRVDEETRVLRRARGLCPAPITVEGAGDDVIAFGAHVKNTFAIAKAGRVFVGPHIGDLDDPLSLGHQAEALGTYLRLFRARPTIAACDLHPDYASTRLAEEWVNAMPAGPVRVQHHHAHIASVMAESGLRGELIGVAFDGAGYGPDGTIWGGEFLICDERRFVRAGHLAPVRQPGGDLCAREGWRMAVAYLSAAGLATEAPPEWLSAPDGAFDERRWRLVARLAGSDMAPLTSSAGRLFDAVASLLGVAHTSSYEAEGAMRLEAVARRVSSSRVSSWPITLRDGDRVVIDAPRLIRHLVDERAAGRPVDELAAMFHESVALAIVTVCDRLRSRVGSPRVALSGGVFQNALLLHRTLELLRERGFAAYANRQVPANDGGISLGQALVAASRAGSGGPR